MGSWETETTKSSFDAKSVISNAISNRDAARSAGTGGAFSGEYSVVGINIESIPKMQEVIRSYVSKVQTHLDGINPLADNHVAYRSYGHEIEDSVQKAVDNIKAYCKNLTSDLLAFNTKLSDVQMAWESTTANLAGTITEDTNASDAGTAYQE